MGNMGEFEKKWEKIWEKWEKWENWEKWAAWIYHLTKSVDRVI